MGEEDKVIQLPGRSCAICERSIVLATDGTWCAKCGSALHVGCVASRGQMCPVCHSAYHPPEERMLRDAQGRSPSKAVRRGGSIGSLVEIVAGVFLLASPLFLFVFGGFIAGMVLAGSGALLLWPLTLVLAVAGAALVVDGDRNWRR